MSDNRQQLNTGLRPLPPDSRDFKLGAVVQLPPLSQLPEEFILDALPVKNQGDSDLCTAYASCGASEVQEGVELCPQYLFALSKSLSGDPDAWGQDLRTAMKAHQKFGAIQEAESPHKNPRLLSDWPDLKDKALVHAKGTYFSAEGPYDPFDDIRALMWKFREQKCAAVIGLEWGWPIDERVLLLPVQGSGHAMWVRGWRMVFGSPFLVVRNSYGPQAGDNGDHLISREVVNANVPRFGAFMFTDMTREEYLDRMRPSMLLSISGILAKLKDIVLSLARLVATPDEVVDDLNEPDAPHISLIAPWALAIQREEGWRLGTRSYRNNNPGNLKASDYTLMLGALAKLVMLGKAIGVDPDGFCIYQSPEAGFKALTQFLTAAARNELRPYKDCTLGEFTRIYAEPPADHPYAENVAKTLGVKVDTPIKDLL